MVRGARLGKADPQPASTRGEAVPAGVRMAAGWAWRLIVIAAAIAIVVLIIVELREIAIPVFVAVVLSALLVPFRDLLTRRLRFPRWLAIVLAELSVISAVGMLMYLVLAEVASGFSDMRNRTMAALDDLGAWLSTSPLHLDGEQLSNLVDQMWEALQTNAGSILPSVFSAGSTVGHVAIGILLALFTTLFILIDGDRIWAWIVRLFPRRARRAIDGAGRSGWVTLQSFVKVQILVASIDAVGIAVGAAILGVPLAIPIGVLVFLGSFIPVIGAIITGAFAVAIALIYNGWVVALLMLLVVLLVQQIEGHVLQPLMMGNAVKIHPLAIVLAVATGSMLAGISGAFFAVPLVAFANAAITYIASDSWRAAEPNPADTRRARNSRAPRGRLWTRARP